MKRLVVGVLLVGAAGCGLQQLARPATSAPNPPSSERPLLGPSEVAITWLGVSGVMVRTPKRTVVVDPYVTRVNCAELVMGDLLPDRAQIDRYIPKVDLILVGHGHADHALDVGYLSWRDQAPVVGSITATNIAQSYGAPRELLHVVGGGELIDVGGVLVDVLRSRHSKLPLIGVPFKGRRISSEPGPLRANEFEAGPSLFFRFIVDGVRIGHLSSAGLPARLPDNLDVDVLFLSLASAKAEDRIVERLLPATSPAFLVPIHFDVPCLGLEETPRRLPGYDVDGVVVQASVASPKTRVLVPDPMREHVLDLKLRTQR